jgi:hypothetical protein
LAQRRGSGSDSLLQWRCYLRRPSGEFFAPSGAGQLGQLVRHALTENSGAIVRNVSVLVGWGEPLDGRSADEVVEMVRGLRPLTTICRERARSDRWVISNFASPMIFPPGAIQRAIDGFVSETFPLWQPRAASPFQPHALLLLQDATAEDLGLVEKVTPSFDQIVALVGSDVEVVEASRLWDRATPSSWRELARARLNAQARAGIPEADRAPLYSGQVDEYLVPILMRMGKGDEVSTLSFLRRDLDRIYGDLGEFVLRFMLRSYRHTGAQELLALATGAKEAA